MKLIKVILIKFNPMFLFEFVFVFKLLLYSILYYPAADIDYTIQLGIFMFCIVVLSRLICPILNLAITLSFFLFPHLPIRPTYVLLSSIYYLMHRDVIKIHSNMQKIIENMNRGLTEEWMVIYYGIHLKFK